MSSDNVAVLSSDGDNVVGFYYPLTAGDETRQGQPLANNTGARTQMHQLVLLRLWFLGLALFPEKVRVKIPGATAVVHKPDVVKTADTALGILFVASYDPPRETPRRAARRQRAGKTRNPPVPWKTARSRLPVAKRCGLRPFPGFFPRRFGAL